MTSFDSPTKAVPGGCIIGLIGVLCWLYTAVCTFFILNRDAIEDVERRTRIVETMFLHGIVSLLLGVALVFFGCRLAVKSDMSDPWDPGKPMVR